MLSSTRFCLPVSDLLRGPIGSYFSTTFACKYTIYTSLWITSGPAAKACGAALHKLHALPPRPYGRPQVPEARHHLSGATGDIAQVINRGKAAVFIAILDDVCRKLRVYARQARKLLYRHAVDI